MTCFSQEQFLDRRGHAVSRRVGRAAARIVIRLRTRLARLRVGIDPVEDRVGGDGRHSRQFQKRLPPGARLPLFPLPDHAQVQPGRFVLQSETDASGLAVLPSGRDDAEPAAEFRRGIVDHEHVAEQLGVVVPAARVPRQPRSEVDLQQFHARGQDVVHLQFGAVGADGLVLGRQQGHETQPRQADHGHHDQHGEHGNAAADTSGLARGVVHGPTRIHWSWAVGVATVWESAARWLERREKRNRDLPAGSESSLPGMSTTS